MPTGPLLPGLPALRERPRRNIDRKQPLADPMIRLARSPAYLSILIFFFFSLVGGPRGCSHWTPFFRFLPDPRCPESVRMEGRT